MDHSEWPCSLIVASDVPEIVAASLPSHQDCAKTCGITFSWYKALLADHALPCVPDKEQNRKRLMYTSIAYNQPVHFRHGELYKANIVSVAIRHLGLHLFNSTILHSQKHSPQQRSHTYTLKDMDIHTTHCIIKIHTTAGEKILYHVHFSELTSL